MIVRVYGTELENDRSAVLRFLGRNWPVVGVTCTGCAYVFFSVLLPEHEPTFCPNCGVRFNAVAEVHEPGPSHGPVGPR